jgi:membrane-associated phospholipid phosphatase
MIGVTASLAEEDGDLQVWIQSRRSGDLDKLARVGKPFGDGRYVLPSLGLLYCLGRMSGSERARETALLGLESVVVSGAITGAMKLLSHKHRPSSGRSEDVPWGGPALSTSHLSFPSGHSSCAFAVGTVVAMEYGDYPLVPHLAYGAAALCAFSRVNDNAHYLSDVIVGSVIGHLTARYVVGRHGRIYKSRVAIRPHVSHRGPGLALSYTF